MRSSIALFAVGLLALGGACSSDETLPQDQPTPGPLLDGPCDPIAPTHCGFPFPSNVYLADDPSTVTKKHVAFGKATLPTVNGTAKTKPATWSDSDGFSPGQAPMTDLPGATVSGLPTQDTIELSTTKDSPTILMEADTGALVPHFAEIDMSSAAKEGDRAFMIRPVVRLKDATRYIVAIRRVVDKSGQPIAPSPAFQALRDGTKSAEVSVERRRALYDGIFAALAKAGIDRADLQIAWDYSTASRENNTRWLLHMRDDALAKVGAEGPEYTIDSIEDAPDPDIPAIARRIRGRMTVPLYLDQPGPAGKLVFGDDGLPKQNGTAEYGFVVQIPQSAASGTPGSPLQHGHGLLGSKDESGMAHLAALADEGHYVVFATDWLGMSSEDYEAVQDSITGDIGRFRAIVDRQHQGLLNALLAMRMMKGRFYKDPAVMFNGKSAIDPSEVYYRGDSQGGIFGTTYMALSTDVTRGMLGVPGMPYNLLLNRSTDFEPFFVGLKIVYKNARDIQIALGLVQMLWDRTEPDGYAPYITENTLPGTPKHEVLLHVAIGDHQVTPLGAHLIARAVGATNLAPVNRSIYGVPESTKPFKGNGMVEYKFDNPEAPKTNTAPDPKVDGVDPHGKVRRLDAARHQTDAWLRHGEVRPFCDGPCDPE
jgi:hypothetical protein